MRLCHCFHLVSWGSNRQRLSCSDPPLSWASRAAILGADCVCVLRCSASTQHGPTDLILFLKGRQPVTGELLTEMYLPDAQCCTQAVFLHRSAENISNSRQPDFAYSSHFSETLSLTSRDFQRMAGNPVPKRGGIGRSELQHFVGRSTALACFVGPANRFPQGGQKMWGMSELLYLRALQPWATRRRRERGRGGQERSRGRGNRPRGEGWEEKGGSEGAWQSHLEDLQW